MPRDSHAFYDVFEALYIMRLITGNIKCDASGLSDPGFVFFTAMLHFAYGVNFNYIPKCKILHKIFLKKVVKTCENDFSNTTCVAKVKVRVEKSYNKTVIDFSCMKNFSNTIFIAKVKVIVEKSYNKTVMQALVNITFSGR